MGSSPIPDTKFSLPLDVGFSPDKRRIVSVGQDETIRVWDPDTGHCMLILQVPPEQKCWNADCRADGRFLAAGTTSRDVLLWDAGPQPQW